MTRTAPFVAAAAFAAAMIALPAIAGEVNGNGDPTPIRERANSICAFSGLNDHPEGQPGNPPGRTQNYGHTLQLMDLVAKLFNPGDICNLGYPLPPE